MTGNRSNLALWFGLAASALVHVFVLLPVLTRMLTLPEDMTAHEARFERDEPRKQDEQQDDLQLGIDKGSPSTLTWIGYEEYEKHLAQLSDVEQAEFTDDPVASPTPPVPMPQPMNAPMDEPSKSAPPAAPQPELERSPSKSNAEANDASKTTNEAQTERPVAGSADVTAQPADETARLDAPVNEDVEPTPMSTAPQQPISEALLALADQLRLLAEAAGAAGRDDALRGATSDAQQAAKDNTSAPQQQAAQQQGQSTPSASATPADPDAERADLDSVASSTVDVPYDELRPGKPLAARGLKLRPQRPEFVTLTVMTSAPGNPLVEIGFTREGKPLVATIVESSGDKRIDNTIEASLYRWRAEGEPLEQLASKETLNVRIRIILNARR